MRYILSCYHHTAGHCVTPDLHSRVKSDKDQIPFPHFQALSLTCAMRAEQTGADR